MTSDKTKEAERKHRWWIVDGVAHRKAEAPPPTEIEFFGETVPVISGPRPSWTDWVCDFCNDTITIETSEGHPQWIPMFSSNALCTQCMYEVMTTAEQERIRQDLQLFVPEWYSRQLCACDGCKESLTRQSRTPAK